MHCTDRRRWTRWIIGIAVVLLCTGMAFNSLPSNSVVIRSEIDLLLDDISEEPTPDNISTLLSKARAARRANHWGFDGSLDENNLAPNEVAHVARYLRKQYPFESLTQRLAYEREAKHTRTRLSDNANAWLRELESEPAFDPYVKTSMPEFAAERAHALTQLHSEEVVAFINRDGEGMSRMPTYGVEFVVLPDVPAIPLSANIGASHHSPPTQGDTTLDVASQQVRYGRQKTRSPFFELHASYREDFAATRNGLIVDVDQVAGFAPHAITHRNDIPSPSPTATQSNTRRSAATVSSITENQPNPLWRVTNLQLVSLLKFDRPHVYLSEFMPAMTELPDLEMRELTSFESRALKRLYAGEDLVSDTTDHKIRMLGSLRASKDCRLCHSVDRGELLGAFSYELVRVGTQSDSRSERLARSTSFDDDGVVGEMRQALVSYPSDTINDLQ